MELSNEAEEIKRLRADRSALIQALAYLFEFREISQMWFGKESLSEGYSRDAADGTLHGCFRFKGDEYPTVELAIEAALSATRPNDKQE